MARMSKTAWNKLSPSQQRTIGAARRPSGARLKKQAPAVIARQARQAAIDRRGRRPTFTQGRGNTLAEALASARAGTRQSIAVPARYRARGRGGRVLTQSVSFGKDGRVGNADWSGLTRRQQLAIPKSRRPAEGGAVKGGG